MNGIVAQATSQWRHTRRGIQAQAFREMTSSPPSWKDKVISEIRLRQQMRIHAMNNGAKFHPDRIWNDSDDPTRTTKSGTWSNEKFTHQPTPCPQLWLTITFFLSLNVFFMLFILIRSCNRWALSSVCVMCSYQVRYGRRAASQVKWSST